MSADGVVPLRILLVDDHAVVREGYRRLLSRDPNLQVVGEAANSVEAITQERALEPDVTVLDIALPGVSGIETLRRILAWRPAARVLMFSMYQESIYARRAFEAGARGYLSKASAPELLVEAVRAVAAGGRYTSPDVEEAIAQQSTKAAELARSLSSREHEILRLLSRGLAATEIGERLGISPKTVANQQWSIKQKLGATSALQLLLIARELGLT
jgi:DNA-binding NarL/FixJ family response regulator